MSGLEDVSASEIEQVYPAVAKAIADALARDGSEVKLKSRLIGDLDAESIDLLDVVFRLERAFKIKIPRGKILDEARGELSESEFEHKGILTDAGHERLRRYMSEIAAEDFPKRMKVSELPALFTVETFCKLVVRAMRRQSAAAAS